MRAPRRNLHYNLTGLAVLMTAKLALEVCFILTDRGTSLRLLLPETENKTISVLIEL